MEYDFIFCTELYIYLPGITTSQATLSAQNKTYGALGTTFLRLPQTTNWSIDDPAGGIRMQFQLQKPSTIWCLPSADTRQAVQGLRLAISLPVHLLSTSPMKFFGKVVCKSIKKIGEVPDAF
jgi:hypothetical protein